MAWDDNLSGTHLEIATFPGSPLRVLAGPGTGKTFALMRRVARLLESGQAEPHEILAVTFTRTAAKDLVDKLQALGAPGAKEVLAKTLHSFCFTLLMRAAVFSATGRHARPLLDHEKKALICDLQEGFGGKRKVSELLLAFESYWATLQSLNPGWPKSIVEANFNKALLEWLRFHEAILIGELVLLAYDFLRNNPESPDFPTYGHVVVDEYQDLNRAEQSLIDLLSTKSSVVVVGDEDQSVYAFRHAHPQGIAEFHTTHAGTTDKLLEVCRRCPSNIVQMAKNLISHNTRLTGTVLLEQPGSANGEVFLVQHKDLAQEAESLATFVASRLSQDKTLVPGQILVLATRRRIGYQIRDALNCLAKSSCASWLAKSFFHEQALEKERAQRGFLLLTLLAHPNDRAALRAWLALGDSVSGRANAYAKLKDFCKKEGIHPREALASIVNGEVKIAHVKPLAARFQSLELELAALEGLKGQALADRLFPDGDPECADIRNAAMLVADISPAPSAMLEDLRTIVTQPEIPGETDNVVRIMSLHKAKGLTARVVLVAGCVAGALPTISEEGSEQACAQQIEEQRRLFYVAITRATQTLVISSAAKMHFKDAMKMGVRVLKHQRIWAILQASPFLSELGPSAPRTVTGEAWRKSLSF